MSFVIQQHNLKDIDWKLVSKTCSLGKGLKQLHNINFKRLPFVNMLIAFESENYTGWPAAGTSAT
jgi:hypothetical protein